MHRTIVLNVVGMTPRLLAHAPLLSALAERGGCRELRTIMPALTCSVQSTFVTGLMPAEHGAVGNGWYDRTLSEILFWRQSNGLVSGEKLWETARRRDPAFTCAQLFWWYNMYAAVDISVTPRPIYLADGRKIPDIHTSPPELAVTLQEELGRFPLFRFWGPAADIVSSHWIADCARLILRRHHPTLTLVYLPHLDYCLQRLGPDHPDIATEVASIDGLCGEILAEAEASGCRILVLSEYGVTPVSRQIHINRALRAAGLLAIRDELGHETLDAGASAAFAVADHQIAHLYVRDPERLNQVRALVERLDGVETVLDAGGKRDAGLDHPRAGDLVAIAAADAWFTYYYWLEDRRAPDFARMVEIHRKPGYDPVELFTDPTLPAIKLQIAWRLLKKAVGLRSLMNVIPLDATLVRGSHGRQTDKPEDGPLLLSSCPGLLPEGTIHATEVNRLLLAHIFN
ncbi:alkaline phosphatase family protein [Telmatospirillum siberiense]|uniref:Alkaline phosphatase family protein n=1 Tax=Telmatospirillum siberiense TaxID=382514 RepID=A0A2N3PZS7_9PROT|nr:nucleotide pyrophosphatase/phosphodiesterase family protein [Telmatospirillum siberiense]PKU25905.1 alkaline phosphatase family protein [Telmatospirillum siberiense]